MKNLYKPIKVGIASLAALIYTATMPIPLYAQGDVFGGGQPDQTEQQQQQPDQETEILNPMNGCYVMGTVGLPTADGLTQQVLAVYDCEPGNGELDFDIQTRSSMEPQYGLGTIPTFYEIRLEGMVYMVFRDLAQDGWNGNEEFIGVVDYNDGVSTLSAPRIQSPVEQETALQKT